jgi:hypothetical protein
LTAYFYGYFCSLPRLVRDCGDEIESTNGMLMKMKKKSFLAAFAAKSVSKQVSEYVFCVEYWRFVGYSM